MKKDITFQEVKNAFKHVDKLSITPDPSRFEYNNEFHVIDENKSVRWNREEIHKRNEKFYQEKDRLKQVRDEAYSKATTLAKQYIQQETHMNEKQCSILWSHFYNLYHPYLIGDFDELEDYIVLMNDIFKCVDD